MSEALLYRVYRGPLVSMTNREFVDELSSDSPAPGGGSVAALCAAQSAGLVAMVANLTVGKKKYAAAQDRVKEIAEEAQELKDFFLDAIDADTPNAATILANLDPSQQPRPRSAGRTVLPHCFGCAHRDRSARFAHGYRDRYRSVPCSERAAACQAPGTQWRVRGTRARADQGADDARPARSAGRGDHAPRRGLLHRARGIRPRGRLPARKRRAHRRTGT